MKTYWCNVLLDSGPLHVEVELHEDATEDEVFDAAIDEIEAQVRRARLDCWGP